MMPSDIVLVAAIAAVALPLVLLLIGFQHWRKQHRRTQDALSMKRVAEAWERRAR